MWILIQFLEWSIFDYELFKIFYRDSEYVYVTYVNKCLIFE